jgi:predicted AlkP superfamily pyrophosphatase or phosphodiesterase
MRIRPRPSAALALLATLVLGACRGTTPQAQSGAPVRSPAQASRVLLLSLDGAGSQELHRLYAEGAFPPGGFARFFQEGQVAEAMVPVNPTLTSTNHVSLATGYDAAATGIVSNRFHAPGSPWGSTVSGFEAPIGTETLWEAARRQGKKVGNATWPGADAKDDRRRADWGIIYTADRNGALVTVERKEWNPVPEGGAGEPPVRSYAPLLTTRVDLPGVRGAAGPSFDVLAIDSIDDGAARYDHLLVLPVPRAAHAAGTADRPSKPLAAGEWWESISPATGAKRVASGSWIKVLKVDPELTDVRLYFGPAQETEAYPEDFAAALTGQGLVWPGAPPSGWLQATFRKQPGVDLTTWTEQADRFAEFFGASLRLAAARPDWDLFMGYMPSIDEAGHTLLLTDPRQPNFSPELEEACAKARLEVWKTVDRQLAGLLAAVDLKTTRVVVVSDHGMTPVHTSLDPAVLLRDKGYLATDEKGKVLPEKSSVLAVSDGGISHLYLGPGLAADPAARERTLAELRTLFADWKVGEAHPLARVLTRKEAAAVGLDHPNSGDLILFAQEGYAFREGSDLKDGARASFPTPVYGMHGYLNTNPDVQGIFLALGPGLKPGRIAPLSSTEVAGKVAGWLGIERPRRQPPAASPAAIPATVH